MHSSYSGLELGETSWSRGSYGASGSRGAYGSTSISLKRRNVKESPEYKLGFEDGYKQAMKEVFESQGKTFSFNLGDAISEMIKSSTG